MAIVCVDCGVQCSPFEDDICIRCKKCHDHCDCRSWQCDCDACFSRFERWWAEQDTWQASDFEPSDL